MYLAIKKVKPQDNYLLLLTFENGEKRQFDMKRACLAVNTTELTRSVELNTYEQNHASCIRP